MLLNLIIRVSFEKIMQFFNKLTANLEKFYQFISHTELKRKTTLM
jgi:hypothetical protein